jgi:WS/DGAT/MGAT family acyltransferase
VPCLALDNLSGWGRTFSGRLSVCSVALATETGSMARLSAVDSSFLRVESPTAHMHVGWLSLVDLPSGALRLDSELLIERIEARLHLAPRFRQRVVKVPLSVAEPVWRDAADFDIRRHVSTLAARGELKAQGLRAAVDEFFSRPLDREHPLWEILVVPRLRGRRAALLGKVHHAMVDGIAAVELGMLMFDLGGGAEQPSPAEWSPAPAEGSLRLVVDSLADTAVDQFRAARRLLSRSPREIARLADTMRQAAFSLAEDALNPAPASYLNPPLGPGRTLVTHRVRLARLLAIKRHHRATLNDLTLAVCAGALRRFAVKCGEQPCDLRVMVPVSVRDEADQPAEGNRITFAFVHLPVATAGADARLARVIERMGELKTSGRIAGSASLLQGLGVLPEPVKERAARLAVSPRLYNLTISNVPGPRVALHVAGARVQSIYPVIPIPDRHALALGVLTYDGHAHFGLYADPEALPRVGALRVLLEDAVMEHELGVKRSPKRDPDHLSRARRGGATGAARAPGAGARPRSG